ncbi:hypothetical protein BURMUCGD1_3500 [Burkholderia multivorans CGD1]|nr:hypothetical protein BURMUCGD1_3500 [Burkholderia multivorans CGD1]
MRNHAACHASVKTIAACVSEGVSRLPSGHAHCDRPRGPPHQR